MKKKTKINKQIEIKSKTNIPIYKYATYSLLVILLLLGASFLIGWYGNNKYEEGIMDAQINVVGQIISNIQQSGSVSVDVGNNTLILVPAEAILLAQENTILTIMGKVEEEGYVSLYEGNRTMYLVEFIPQEEQRDVVSN